MSSWLIKLWVNLNKSKHIEFVVLQTKEGKTVLEPEWLEAVWGSAGQGTKRLSGVLRQLS